MMSRPARRFRAALCGLVLALAAASGCAPDEPEAAAGEAVAAETEWQWLRQAKQELDAKRARLAALEAPGAESPSAETNTTEREPLRQDIERLQADFGRRLVDFINADPPVQGEPLSERQKAALRMRSDEEILVARDYVERGGDHRRAIEILEAALAVDPANPRLEAELARARSLRYMTEERFFQAKEGMTQDEVRRLLGQPNLHHVRSYPERGVEAWFFLRDEEGSAAAVWFQKDEGGGLRVYKLDFQAVQPPAPAPAAPAP